MLGLNSMLLLICVICVSEIYDASFIVTWMNFNPSMDSNHMPSKVQDGISYHSQTSMAAAMKFGNG